MVVALWCSSSEVVKADTFSTYIPSVASGTTSDIYVSNVPVSEHVYAYINPNHPLTLGGKYSIGLFLNYSISSNLPSLVNFYPEFTIYYDGVAYKPSSYGNGSVGFSFQIDASSAYTFMLDLDIVHHSYVPSYSYSETGSSSGSFSGSITNNQYGDDRISGNISNSSQTNTGNAYGWHQTVNFTYSLTGCTVIISDLPDSDSTVVGELQNGNNLQQNNNSLVQQGNQLQEQANTIANEQKETSKGILGKITEFFGGFFSNLENSILHLVVPTAQEITTFLDSVNTWFSARLGFIWYPFDLAIRLVSALAGGSADSLFTVPSLSLNILGQSYTIWNELTVNLDEFGIFVYVRFFTSALLASLTVKLAVDKWDEWIGGHDG